MYSLFPQILLTAKLCKLLVCLGVGEKNIFCLFLGKKKIVLSLT